MPNIYTTKTDVTPEMAQRLMKINTSNRPISYSRVNYYADLMRRGLWADYSNDAVCLDEAERLLNGQHRLLAIIQSEMTVPLYITYNAPAESQNFMDTGKARNLSDVLTINGRNYGVWRAGCYSLFTHLAFSQRGKKKVGYEAVVMFDFMDQAITEAIELGKQRFAVGGIIGGAALTIHLENPVKMKEFYSLVVSGENLTRQHPAYRFREWYMRKPVGTRMIDIAHRYIFFAITYLGNKKTSYKEAAAVEIVKRYGEYLKNKANKKYSV